MTQPPRESGVDGAGCLCAARYEHHVGLCRTGKDVPIVAPASARTGGGQWLNVYFAATQKRTAYRPIVAQLGELVISGPARRIGKR